MGQRFCRMVLVVADDADPAAAAVIARIADSLRDEGFSLIYATTARDGTAQVRTSTPDRPAGRSWGISGPCRTWTAGSPDSAMTSMAWNRRPTGPTGSCASRMMR